MNFVFSSSCATYGTPNRLPLLEDDPQLPVNPYGQTYLGRDIGRRIDGDLELEEIFARPLSLSRRVLAQDQRQRGPKV
jgi:hypothetical protein